MRQMALPRLSLSRSIPPTHFVTPFSFSASGGSFLISRRPSWEPEKAKDLFRSLSY